LLAFLNTCEEPDPRVLLGWEEPSRASHHHIKPPSIMTSLQHTVLVYYEYIILSYNLRKIFWGHCPPDLQGLCPWKPLDPTGGHPCPGRPDKPPFPNHTFVPEMISVYYLALYCIDVYSSGGSTELCWVGTFPPLYKIRYDAIRYDGLC